MFVLLHIFVLVLCSSVNLLIRSTFSFFNCSLTFLTAECKVTLTAQPLLTEKQGTSRLDLYIRYISCALSLHILAKDEMATVLSCGTNLSVFVLLLQKVVALQQHCGFRLHDSSTCGRALPTKGRTVVLNEPAVLKVACGVVIVHSAFLSMCPQCITNTSCMLSLCYCQINSIYIVPRKAINST